MSDIEQVLTDTELEPPTLNRSLDDMIGKAHASTHQRRVVIAGTAASVAIALAGGLAYVGTSAEPTQNTIKLAAYDHVLGSDPQRPGNLLVFGPADRHTAHCTLQRHTGDKIFRYYHRDRSLKLAGHSRPYYVFSCPTK